MKKLVIETEQGLEIYKNQAFILADEYINTLPVPEMIYTKSVVFNGMLKYIYLNMFKPTIHDRVKYNSNTKIDTSDILLLNEIWDNIFSVLCSMYNSNKTIQRFSMLTGITHDVFNTWKNGKYRTEDSIYISGNGEKIRLSHSESYKRWLSECESDLVSRAGEENSVGSMFLLKSCYNYRDNTTVTIEGNNTGLPAATAEQIAQRHNKSLLEAPPPITVEI